MKNKLTMEEIETLLQRNIEMLQTYKKINQLKESIKKKIDCYKVYTIYEETQLKSDVDTYISLQYEKMKYEDELQHMKNAIDIKDYQLKTFCKVFQVDRNYTSSDQLSIDDYKIIMQNMFEYFYTLNYNVLELDDESSKLIKDVIEKLKSLSFLKNINLKNMSENLNYIMKIGRPIKNEDELTEEECLNVVLKMIAVFYNGATFCKGEDQLLTKGILLKIREIILGYIKKL